MNRPDPFRPSVRVVAAAACLAFAHTAAAADPLPAAGVVHHQFENILPNLPSGAGPTSGTILSSSAYAFGGNNGGTVSLPALGRFDVPTSSGPGGVVLAESQFGTFLTTDQPYPDFVATVIRSAQDLLYTDSGNPIESPAFRYKTTLYGPDNGRVAVATTGSIWQRYQDDLAASPAPPPPVAAKPSGAAFTSFPSIPFEPGLYTSDASPAAAALMSLSAPEQLTLATRQANAESRDAFRRKLAADADGRAAGSRARRAALRSGGGIPEVRANFEDMDAFFNDDDRANADLALNQLRLAMKYAPGDPRLANSYLDIFYDKAVAELQFAKQGIAKRAQMRLGFLAPAAGEQTIDTEIRLLESEILPVYKTAIAPIGQLLLEQSAVDVASDLDANAPQGIPLGLYLFKAQEPVRGLNAAQYRDPGDGLLKTVPNAGLPGVLPTTATRPLLNGYREYALICQVEANYLDDLAELVRLYALRGRLAPTDDLSSASALINIAMGEQYLNTVLLASLFPEFNDAPANDVSGVTAARAALTNAVNKVSSARSFLLGTKNLLGFTDDFLVLSQQYPGSALANNFDSYDALKQWVVVSDLAPLRFAQLTYEDAFRSYNTYRNNQDTYKDTVDAAQTAASNRYYEIIGLFLPDATPDWSANPGAGAVLEQARRDVEIDTARYQALRQQKDAITAQIASNEYYVNVELPGINSGRLAAYIQQQANITTYEDQITNGNVAQVVSQAIFDTAAATAPLVAEAVANGTGLDVNIGGAVAYGVAAGVVGIAGIANTAVQGVYEQRKGDAQKNLDLATSVFESTLASLDAQQDSFAAKDALASLLREGLAVTADYYAAYQLLLKDKSNVDGLVGEAADMRAKFDAAKAKYADRYYADPGHIDRYQGSSILADNAFAEAQKWAFFLQRAVEFKWNKPFVVQFAGTAYDRGSIFRTRNYPELRNLVNAYNAFDLANSIGANREPFVDRLSLRDDIFQSDAGSTTPQQSIVKFRTRLAQLRNPVTGNYEIPLNTFIVKKDDGFFFEGPDRNTDGSVLTAGKYLDKIEWLKFNVVTEPAVAPKVISANFSYAGTAYIRNRVPPCLDGGPATQTREFAQFPFRYFLTLDNGGSWLERGSQDDTVKVVFSPSSTEPVDTAENPYYRNTFLKERSVAATSQKLTISGRKIDVSKVNDIEVYVRHLFLSRDLPVCN